MSEGNPLSRQQRRYLERNQRKQAPHDMNGRISGVVTPATVLAIASEIPTHAGNDAWVLSAPPRGRWQVTPGRWLTYLDLNAWHEVAHAVVLLSRGWHVWYLRVVSQEDPASEGLSNRCHAQVLSVRSALELQRDAALSAVAGPVAVTNGMAGKGLRGFHYGETLSGPDRAAVDDARAAIGIPSEDAATFEQELRDEAFTLIHRHRHQFGALVAGLTTHNTLNAHEVLRIWQRGAFDFAGRISEMPRLVRREDLATPTFRQSLADRFGCTT